jgi:predicted enzyme related to lactoylglutathione lyase
MFRYVHTNIIAKDANKLITFYKTVFHCQSINETRNLRGAWLDKLTGLSEAHITGEHLLLPGYEIDHPTLEIFSYDELKEAIEPEINRPGIAHLAFEVDDVESTLAEIIKAGGSSLGELVTAAYPDNQEAVFVYARDPEGNIIELQSWRQINPTG